MFYRTEGGNFCLSVGGRGSLMGDGAWGVAGAGGAGKPRTVRYLFFTVICVFITVIVYLYIPGKYFLNTFDQTFHF